MGTSVLINVGCYKPLADGAVMSLQVHDEPNPRDFAGFD